jgi:hypothetical protein
MKKAEIMKSTFQLQPKAENHGNEKVEAEYNQIQTESIAIGRDVESPPRPLKMGGIRWSPKLHNF